MTVSRIMIRPARPDDLNVIVQFNQALAGETEDKALDDAVIREGVRRLLADSRRGRYFIAEVDGMVVGQTMVTYEWSDWRNGDFWWIQSVYVSPEFRSRGVFRSLHAHVRDAANQADGVCGLRLYVYERNARAMEAYLNLGLVRTDYLMFEEDWSAAVSHRGG
jgi:GNAT superfamily N-acetyltransferase